MNLNHAIEILRANEASLRARGILHAAIFGSLARGAARPDSDVDVLVEIDPARHLGVFDFVGIKLDLEELMSAKVDLVEKQALKQPMREFALKESINVF